MTGENEGDAYARRWRDAWNSGVLADALALWADDLEFESPLAKDLTGSAIIRGKAAAEAYWGTALQQVAHLHFELRYVFWDASKRVVTIIYRRERGADVRLAGEIVRLDEHGRGVHGIALHGAVLE